MSHLSLDARAILEYLNELGYRNISAEQLKEFMKGMQPQLETSKSKHKAKSSSNQQPQPQPRQQQREGQQPSAAPAPVTRATDEGKLQPQPQSPRRSPIKVIRCKKPLCHFKFYLDVRDHQLTKKIEEQVKVLGGTLEFFLTPCVTHFITDKTVLPPTTGNSNNNNNNTLSSRPGTPQTPATPNTPQTPYSLESNDGKNNSSNTPSGNKRTRQSRADAILNRVRRQNATTSIAAAAVAVNAIAASNEPAAASLKSHTEETVRSDATQPYVIWQTEYALHFFSKVHHELKEYLSTRDRKLTVKGCTVEPISLKGGGYLKIEAIKRNYRPYYQLFRKSGGTEWPKIELTREDGAFRLAPKKTHQQELEAAAEEQERTRNMTRKSRSRSSQHQRPVAAAVQSLKKGEPGAKTGTGHRNSNMGGVGCKQVKESSDKQCGVCEICKIEYDTLTIHLKTKDHEYFARNSQNFIALDSLIHASADVNKFLGDNKKMELEEMEVEEDVTVDVNAPDPLEAPEPLLTRGEEKRRSSGAHKTPSPTLREKSKRSTKGKHSSEKFQNTTKLSAAKLPKTSPKCISSLKKPSSSMLELQRIEAAAVTAKAVSAASPATTTRRKPSAATSLSPPIRAMLPPSSLYKVVETPDACTPVRKVRDTGESMVASPSLIVKFKKVRTTELHRLNGEAESFMFPKRRTSSELPTDVDRQTTSENARVSVSPTSFETSSEPIDIETAVEETPTSLQHQQSKAIKNVANPAGKRAIVTAKRRKGQQQATGKQSFPSAPIQPEVQLKRARKPLAATAAATIAAASANITLPEATRKSSRTATAIVTAATTSSRLLRAAVEAAKNNSRRIAAHDARRCSLPAPAPTPIVKCATAGKPADAVATSPMQMRSRVPVVKMEDRMGDDEPNTDESDNDEDDDNDDDSQDNDEEDEESDYEHDDDDDDEDYVNRKVDNYKRRQPHASCTTSNAVSNYAKRSSSRNQRAAQRENRKTYTKTENADESDEEREKYKVRKVSALKMASSKLKHGQQCPAASPAKKSPTQRIFNYASSDRLNKLRYAFERLPATDLWYRVFTRQDACDERYFEYYGSTSYRKLPYELGPIPFERTLDGIRCKLCSTHNAEAKTNTVASSTRIQQEDEPHEKSKSKEPNANIGGLPHSTIAGVASSSSPTHSAAASATSSQYTLKHKKLHLLQRYQQEQQALLQKQQRSGLKEEHQEEKAPTALAGSTAPSKCDSKASSPERDRARERAGSTHSNTSSCASSTATQSRQKYRNKHLNKAAFLNLELPPRKSPREHASTLALVSCIIKQRQDSQSKPNSETDEPPLSTPTPTPASKEETRHLSRVKAPAATQHTQAGAAADATAVRSPHNTRSVVVTPVEELRFTTEISENVKRMRRGQNKYDHSPPIVLHSSRSPRGRQPKSPLGRRPYLQKHRSQTPNMTAPTVKRRKRQKCTIGNMAARHHSYSGLQAQGSALPSIRKTGSKKGVLEFEVDSTALKSLDAATKHTDMRQLEWEIDKYLQLAGREYDTALDIDVPAGIKDTIALDVSATAQVLTSTSSTTVTTTTSNTASTSNAARRNSATLKLEGTRSQSGEANTPPPTDYFSSDFDLYDLFTGAYTGGSDEEQTEGKRKGFCLYNSMALQNYFRKRKNLKSNRTGWPKVQRKKSSARQQQMLEQKIRFLRDIGELNRQAVKEEPEEEAEKGAEAAKKQTRENGVMTPPDSEVDEHDDGKTVAHDEDAADDTELEEGCESVPEEDDADAETMADSIEEEREVDADADEEDDGDAEGDGDGDGDHTAEEDAEEEDEFVPAKKHTRRSTAASPVEKLVNSLPHSTSAATSTPSLQMLRGLRRTPQLNGSLGSCISPSEKAGDNSDIFTVSSDGLDTDLDMSNSHSQHRGDDEHSHNHHEHCPNHTPKRKFDLSRYTSNSATSSTCAAEAATAAVKSLAISQFLKKEVRVTCRRLRAPFRRFRYRR